MPTSNCSKTIAKAESRWRVESHRNAWWLHPEVGKPLADKRLHLLGVFGLSQRFVDADRQEVFCCPVIVLRWSSGQRPQGQRPADRQKPRHDSCQSPFLSNRSEQFDEKASRPGNPLDH